VRGELAESQAQLRQKEGQVLELAQRTRELEKSARREQELEQELRALQEERVSQDEAEANSSCLIEDFRGLFQQAQRRALAQAEAQAEAERRLTLQLEESRGQFRR
jgi:hypothetical protein